MGRSAIIIFYIVLIAGCNGHNTSIMSQLEAIDSLAIKEEIDSAYILFEKINEDDLKSDEEKALYGILKTRMYVYKEFPITNDSLTDRSIEYYKRTGNKKRLPSAYYYKGVSLYLRGKTDSAIYFIKEAEVAEKAADLPWLRHLIYFNLGYINNESGAYKAALAYSRKAIDNAIASNNPSWIFGAYNSAAMNYFFMGKKDSSLMCMKKIGPYVSKVKDKNDIIMYICNLGYLYYELGEYKKATPLIEKAFKMIPVPTTRIKLAKLYYAINRKAEADSLMKEAWIGATFEQKKEILDFLAEKAEKEKRFEEASDLYKKSQAMQDSITMKRKTEEIITLQTEHDRLETEQKAKDREIIIEVIFALIVLFLAVSSVLLYRRSTNKARKEMEKSRKTLARLTAMLEEAESSKRSNEHEIKRLKNAADKQKKKMAAILDRGRDLHESITAGGTTAGWAKSDFEAVIEYVRVKHPESIERIENSHNRLTAYNTFFLLLDATGTGTDETARIMGISAGAVRTMKHRLRKREKQES